jgi:hypothetical protein
VIVDGRPLMLGRTLQHIDRAALMEDVAAAAASAIAQRDSASSAGLEQVRRRIVEHYQDPVWHAASP